MTDESQTATTLAEASEISRFKEAAAEYELFEPGESIDPLNCRYVYQWLFLRAHQPIGGIWAQEVNGWEFRTFSPYRRGESGEGIREVLFRPCND